MPIRTLVRVGIVRYIALILINNQLIINLITNFKFKTYETNLSSVHRHYDGNRFGSY